MKPGLRKVAALILVSATLFGSGASVVSAAYADDTTMGTSTRIQAEPDVKTTTGGDEAATKPDAGSGDEAGTGADEQSGTGAPAQSAPQADAGQAAPDVTVHDMLDTDSATVSRLRLIDRITGTAPFDADNARGDDKDENNDIVRSYDTVTYDYEYTLTPDSTMDYYRRTRVGFRFELPYPKDKVTFDAEKMGWVDHTPGYEPKLTTETIDGTVTQVYTCYRLLEPTSQSPTVNPGTGSIGLSVAVKGRAPRLPVPSDRQGVARMGRLEPDEHGHAQTGRGHAEGCDRQRETQPERAHGQLRQRGQGRVRLLLGCGERAQQGRGQGDRLGFGHRIGHGDALARPDEGFEGVGGSVRQDHL